ncbi:MAG: hypothetical protein V1718_03925 [archaeon]
MNENRHLMQRRIGIGFIVMFIFAVSSVYAPPIFVSISGKIQGTIDYTNYSSIINGAPQSILMNIENIGSAGCITKVRADFYKDARLLKTSWSEIRAIEPGDHFLFHNYWIPDEEGNISANITIYQCHELFKREPINFYVSNKTIYENNNIRVVETKNSKNEINMTLLSNKTLDKILIIPSNNPLGWIVEPQKINRLEKDEEKTITIEYEAGIWHADTISFDIITEDGTEHIKNSVYLKEEEQKKESIDKNIIIMILILVVAFLTVEIFRLRRERKKKKTNDEKNMTKSGKLSIRPDR